MSKLFQNNFISHVITTLVFSLPLVYTLVIMGLTPFRVDRTYHL